MLKEVVLASYTYFDGGAIGEMFTIWEQAGFFSYIMPFLLIFSLIFAILERIKIFKDNKAINGIIAAVVGLMSLQVPMVSQFFAEIFPRLGIGLAILLVVLILVGLFIDPEKGGFTVTLFVIGLIILIAVLIQTAGGLGWSSGSWWADNWQLIVGIMLVMGLVGIIVGSGTPGTPFKPLGFKE
ncbi:MAG TPA: hypothetical protein ENG87_03410 [Candidatus Pacearchaeota archaeon]|nr:hypothetical protein BMS3Abin17_00522 [archaeon BMS3Abin17]HDK42401.1 hypothetical protein [Candidatus Pacearchaeota archaeon]HDZ60457.1 hypothetical protein [Candidatus Pacearchaeota archaeon]